MSSFINNKTKLTACLAAILICQVLSCKKLLDLDPPASAPSAVFEDAWKKLDRDYALFTVKGINWDSIYNLYKPKFSGSLTNTELFNRLSEMLDLLKDGHVSLINEGRSYSYTGFFKPFPANFNFPNIEKNYLNNQYSRQGPVLYKVADSVGYLYYSSFAADISFADLEIIFSALSKTKGLIVDIRNNTGGKLANAEKLFSLFIKDKTLVKYEMQKSGPGHNDFKEKEAWYIAPFTSCYNKPVAVLTNRSCFSACNDFALYMSNLPGVTLIGDQTGGGGSIPANYILPNGWKLQYASTVTLTPDSTPAEFGIRPDIAIDITPGQELNGLDPILERAYLLLK